MRRNVPGIGWELARCVSRVFEHAKGARSKNPIIVDLDGTGRGNRTPIIADVKRYKSTCYRIFSARKFVHEVSISVHESSSNGPTKVAVRNR